MRAILEFNLPEETVEHELAVNGWKWQMVLRQVDDKLRSRLKYDTNKEWDADTCDAIRHLINSTCFDNGLELY
jgi:hypothetical protein